MLVTSPDRKHIPLAASHKPSCEASRRAECGKSACSVRRGGGWKPATVRLVRHSQRKRRAPDRPDLRAWRHSSTLPGVVCRAPPHSSGAPQHRTFPLLNLHRTRVRRNHGRPRSNGFIERARNTLPDFTAQSQRASDKALTFIRHYTPGRHSAEASAGEGTDLKTVR